MEGKTAKNKRKDKLNLTLRKGESSGPMVDMITAGRMSMVNVTLYMPKLWKN